MLDTDDRIPYVRRARRVPLQLLARRRPHARAVATHHAGPVPHGRTPSGTSCSTSTPSPTAEGENWVWPGAQVLRPEQTRAARQLSRGGADATVVREFDLVGRGFVGRTASTCPRRRPTSAGSTRDTVYVGTDFGDRARLTDSGYPRIVKRWRRGTPLADGGHRLRGRDRDDVASAPATTTPPVTSGTSSTGLSTSSSPAVPAAAPARLVGSTSRTTRARQCVPRLAADPSAHRWTWRHTLPGRRAARCELRRVPRRDRAT